MAIWSYAVSKHSIIWGKINVWGRMLLVVMAATMGTETVVASNPTVTVPFDQRQSLSESGGTIGFASSPVLPSHEYQANQRWVF
ncbi:MAG: hypothetical protein GAK37_03034 [Pseudomonas sp.]|nr:MAG: hypothetical protein GAK37_03034 [Pseudomonas sp.]